MANKQEKRYSTASLVNRAMKSKATMRYPYTSIRKMKICKIRQETQTEEIDTIINYC